MQYTVRGTMRVVGVKQITDGINPRDGETRVEGLTNDSGEIVATTSRSDGGGETNGFVLGADTSILDTCTVYTG